MVVKSFFRLNSSKRGRLNREVEVWYKGYDVGMVVPKGAEIEVVAEWVDLYDVPVALVKTDTGECRVPVDAIELEGEGGAALQSEFHPSPALIVGFTISPNGTAGPFRTVSLMRSGGANTTTGSRSRVTAASSLNPSPRTSPSPSPPKEWPQLLLRLRVG